MTYHSLPQYLRTFRREWALSQVELARLLGIRRQQVSRLELGVRRPSIAVLLSIEVVFGTRTAELFPKLYDEIEERTVCELYLLHKGLDGDARPASLRKRELLQSALDRAVGATPTNYDNQFK